MLEQIIKNNIQLLDLVKKNNIDFNKNIQETMIDLVMNKENYNSKTFKKGLDTTNYLMLLLFKNGISINSNLINSIELTIK